ASACRRAEVAVVAAAAYFLRGLGFQTVLAQGLRCGQHIVLYVLNELLVHGPSLLPLVIELVDLDVVCPATGKLLVAQRVDVQLGLGDLVPLSAVTRLQVDDGDLVRVQTLYQVDPTDHPDAVPQRDLDGLFGELEPAELTGVLANVALDYAPSGG